MARTLHPDLLTAQTTSGYPTGGYAEAVKCILTSKDGATTYDYSFNPTVNTNRLFHAQQVEGVDNDSGLILLNNNDRTIPENLTGYYVDLGWGHNTSSGVRYSSSDGAVGPRLWVVKQSIISGGQKGAKPMIYTLFQLEGVWSAVLNRQPMRLGDAPYFRDYAGALANQTVYNCISYLIETSLSNQTGVTFTLDALGTQDDGLISTIEPFDLITAGSFVDKTTYRIQTIGTTDFTLIGASANTVGVEFIATGVGAGTGTARIELRSVNENTPTEYETYGGYLKRLLSLTNCVIRPEPALAFKIIYPQSSDAVDETYYSSNASGHPFYQAENTRLVMMPNHIEVRGIDLTTGEPTVVGDWYDPDHFTTPPTYSGPFMEVLYTHYNQGLTTEAQCDNMASALGRQFKDQIRGARVIVPMDARVEIGDRISVVDSRGY